MEQETKKENGWVKVFEQLENDIPKLFSGTGFGLKKPIPSKEIVFFLGNIRAVLTKDGFNFEVYKDKE